MELQTDQHLSSMPTGRVCLRIAINEIAVAADYLNDAVTAHILGNGSLAEDLIKAASIVAIREWVESLWGKSSPYVQYRHVPEAPAAISRAQRQRLRMPTSAEKRTLHMRDGYHCRFCGIPVIRAEIRNLLRKLYPDALPWPNTNKAQHPAFQAMWAQYDHVIPQARGGGNDLENIIVTCAPCNFARMNYTLEEVGLADPRTREPIRSTWDGLERLQQLTDKPCICR
jgi:HNH endonuclease